jgi:hypothetical protein
VSLKQHIDVGGLIEDHGPIPWDQPVAAHAHIGRIFDRLLTEDGLLGRVVSSVGDHVRGCESYPAMDKLLLWQSPDSRLRLHLFSPGYVDRPHNHRWNFATRVLAGRYLHSVYGTADEVLDRVTRGTAPDPMHVHELTGGTGYFLDHRLVHSLATDTHTVTLLLRGPEAAKDYFTWEPSTASIVWSTGAVRESAEQRRDKVMSAEGYARVVRLLHETGVL